MHAVTDFFFERKGRARKIPSKASANVEKWKRRLQIDALLQRRRRTSGQLPVESLEAYNQRLTGRVVMMKVGRADALIVQSLHIRRFDGRTQRFVRQLRQQKLGSSVCAS